MYLRLHSFRTRPSVRTPGLSLLFVASVALVADASVVSASPSELGRLTGNYVGGLDLNDNGVWDIATFTETSAGVQVEVFDLSVSVNDPIWTHEVSLAELCGDCVLENVGAGLLDLPGGTGPELFYAWTQRTPTPELGGIRAYTIPDGLLAKAWEFTVADLCESCGTTDDLSRIAPASAGTWDPASGEELVINWTASNRFGLDTRGVSLVDLATDEILDSTVGLQFAGIVPDVSGDGREDALLYSFPEFEEEPDQIVLWSGSEPTSALVNQSTEDLTQFGMSGPTPNPSSDRVQWNVDLPTSGSVEIEIYDASGRIVNRESLPALPAGTHAVTWDGAGVAGRKAPSGVYWIRSTWEGQERKAKVLRLGR